MFSALGELSADDAHAALTKLHGIGPWTADIYLLTCLGHADAWPAGDLALQEAARLAFGLRARPNAKQMVKLAEIVAALASGGCAAALDLLSHGQRARRGAYWGKFAFAGARESKSKTNTKRGANGRRA